jgi:hypothetical protein
MVGFSCLICSGSAVETEGKDFILQPPAALQISFRELAKPGRLAKSIGQN